MPDRSQDERFMRLAIEKALAGVEAGGSPFGCCIVRDGEVVAADHNVVWQTTDITAHAEVTAIRSACRALGTIDLAGCTVYTTTEPCPMCFSAIHWAHADRIVYGTSIEDAAAAGFRELPISNETMKRLGGAAVEVEGGFLRDECAVAFERFRARGGEVY